MCGNLSGIGGRLSICVTPRTIQPDHQRRFQRSFRIAMWALSGGSKERHGSARHPQAFCLLPEAPAKGETRATFERCGPRFAQIRESDFTQNALEHAVSTICATAVREGAGIKPHRVACRARRGLAINPNQKLVGQKTTLVLTKWLNQKPNRPKRPSAPTRKTPPARSSLPCPNVELFCKLWPSS